MNLNKIKQSWMRALFHYSSVMADRGKPRNITIFSSASPLLMTSLKLSENFWSWGLDNKMACWYHQDCLNSLRAECNIRASKEGRELICNCQKCSKTQNPEPFCFVINCLGISFLSGYCEGANKSSLLSPHSLSQIWTRDPGNESVRKKHITGKYTPRTGHEPAACFPFLPGIRDSGFWTLQFWGNCFTCWLWFHPQQCLAGVWRATGQSWPASVSQETKWNGTISMTYTRPWTIRYVCQRLTGLLSPHSSWFSRLFTERTLPMLIWTSVSLSIS